MRFKATLCLERVADLITITSVLAKFHRRIILHLTPSSDDRFEFIVAPGSMGADVYHLEGGRHNGALAVWASLERTSWFSTYQIESRAQDHIALELETSSFTEALRSASRGQLAQLRLRRKAVSVLSLEIALENAPTHEWDIVQDVVVDVLPPVRLEELHEPVVDAGVRGVVLSNPERLHAATKRLRNFHRYGDAGSDPLHAYLQLSMKGKAPSTATLRLWIPTETLRIGMTFTTLKVALIDGDGSAPPEVGVNGTSNVSKDLECEALSEQRAKVLVHTLANALEAHLVGPRQTFCFLLSNCVLFHFAGEDFEVSCYVPLHHEGDGLTAE
jgi:hypothetical protein